MSPAISADDLRRETETTINQRIAGLYADGNTARGVLAALAVAAIEAAADTSHWMKTWLADGAASREQIPGSAPSDDDRDRMLLAAMTAAANAAALAGAVRRRQRIDRPTGWDPLHLPPVTNR